MAGTRRPSSKPAPRRRYGQAAARKVARTLHGWKRGRLRSSSGERVRRRDQAVAIGLSQARRAGAKVPAPPTGGRQERDRRRGRRTGSALRRAGGGRNGRRRRGRA